MALAGVKLSVCPGSPEDDIHVVQRLLAVAGQDEAVAVAEIVETQNASRKMDVAFMVAFHSEFSRQPLVTRRVSEGRMSIGDC